MWESCFSPFDVRMLRLKTNVFIGVGAIQKMNYIAKMLKRKGVDKVIAVTGKGSYIKSGAWDPVVEALKSNGIEYVLYNEIKSNPTADQADKAALMGRKFGAQAVIGIGGGSPIDAAKTVAVLLANPETNCRDLYEYKFIPKKAAPIVAINLTHGTSTEINRYAVVSIPEKQHKPGIVYDLLNPLYAINDPALMTNLPEKQSVYVSVDAVNHVFEAATSTITTPLAILMAQETIRLVAEHLPKIIKDPKELTSRYYLAYAAMIAGIALENGSIHITHAMEHPMSALKPDLSHGLGLSTIFPAVLRKVYASKAPLIASIMAPIIPGLKGTEDETEAAVAGLKKWHASVGITETLGDIGFKREDIPRLVDLIYDTPTLEDGVKLCPTPCDRAALTAIFEESF
ncbi:MAG: iron-containing alcohol dehydrogenase [Negativicutes bacterium]|nr:iron-containing alcohol dehydrogenase [Negativicutes bacterium]